MKYKCRSISDWFFKVIFKTNFLSDRLQMRPDCVRRNKLCVFFHGLFLNTRCFFFKKKCSGLHHQLWCAWGLISKERNVYTTIYMCSFPSTPWGGQVAGRICETWVEVLIKGVRYRAAAACCSEPAQSTHTVLVPWNYSSIIAQNNTLELYCPSTKETQCHVASDVRLSLPNEVAKIYYQLFLKLFVPRKIVIYLNFKGKNCYLPF